MSIDTFGHSPSWTHDEMVAAGYVTDDEAQTLTPRGQLRQDLDAIAENTGDPDERDALDSAARCLDDVNHSAALAARLREIAADEPDGGREDVISCTADTIDPDRRGVGDPSPVTRSRIPAEETR